MFRFKKHHWALWLFVGLTIVGMVLHYLFGSESGVWEFWSAVDVAFAVALGVWCVGVLECGGCGICGSTGSVGIFCLS